MRSPVLLVLLAVLAAVGHGVVPLLHALGDDGGDPCGNGGPCCCAPADGACGDGACASDDGAAHPLLSAPCGCGIPGEVPVAAAMPSLPWGMPDANLDAPPPTPHAALSWDTSHDPKGHAPEPEPPVPRG